MGIFDYLKRKKNTTTENIEDIENIDISKLENYNQTLEQEIVNFFPQQDGSWTSHCFRKSKEIGHANLPCHLRDNSWLSKLFHQDLAKKGINIPTYAIKRFMDTSPLFETLRHNYELEIVKWQIDYMRHGGDGWLMPAGFDEFSLLFSNQVDVMFRGGVVKTLSAIGMNREVIEEGIELNADLWRDRYMNLSFSHEFEPVVFLKGSPEKASEEFRQNWLTLRNYNYYNNHKRVVDLYGTKANGMDMSEEEAKQLQALVEMQATQRRALVQHWDKTTSPISLSPSLPDEENMNK